jgi:hypothetical protein
MHPNPERGLRPFSRSLLSNVNRYALMGFSFPSILTFTQFLFCTVAIRVLCVTVRCQTLCGRSADLPNFQEYVRFGHR